MEFIRDQKDGAVTLKFSDLPTEQLREMVWSFPEAFAEYLKRFTKERLKGTAS